MIQSTPCSACTNLDFVHLLGDYVQFQKTRQNDSMSAHLYVAAALGKM